MKYLFILFVVVCVALHCQAQNKTQAQDKLEDECIVYFVDDVKKFAQSDSKPNESFEVGRFFATGAEGSFIQRRFRLGKSNLFVFASVFYEDDLFYDDLLHDAMTFRIAITRSARKNTESWIALSSSQIEDTNSFRVAVVSALVNQNGKQSGVQMRCQRKIQ